MKLAADVVMEHDHTIDGRLVDVKRALPRDQAPGPARCIAFPFSFSDRLSLAACFALLLLEELG
jgi:hypothetical protein